jgi:uncharacterized protein (TIGR02996 family)
MTEEALLTAVSENADDDAPRLIYSDWLEERGHSERAELIRLQCRLTRLDRRDPLTKPFRVRAKQLLGRFEQAWSKPWRDCGATDIVFHRGFPEGFRISAHDLLRHADELSQLGPIVSLKLDVPGEGWVQMAQCLDVEVSTHPGFPALVQSSVARAREAPGEDLAGVLNLSLAGRLRSLDIASCRLADGDMRVLAEVTQLTGLRSLILDYNHISPVGAAALSAAPFLRQLDDLQISYNSIGDEGLGRLATALAQGKLRRLDVSVNGIGDEGVRRLCAPPAPDRLADLVLDGNYIGDAGAAALGSAPFASALREVWLRSNCIGDAGVRSLLASAGLIGVRHLTVDDNLFISSDALEAVQDRWDRPQGWHRPQQRPR